MIENLQTSADLDESDDYLIELMGLKDDFPYEALDAYGKIYSRYWDIMLRVAAGVTKDEDEAQDLLADTFNIVYNKASTFKKGKIRNPSNVRISIMKWMTTIMQRVFYDYYLQEQYKSKGIDSDFADTHIIEDARVIKYLDDDYDDFIENLEKSELLDVGSAIIETEHVEDSQNLKNVREYVSRLSERDRDIILTIYNHHIPGKYTPNEVLTALEKKWGTTRENIRKILQKFRDSIKEKLQPHMFIRK
ncbi:RNA polymerase sigma factor [Dyadobacter sediminis]|uniref:Sigma-70 family RNA polymerase sigma factor n=1 Tax=Dyadobacter sediminis TaxID=1493691 RepID=A0A5R9K5N8_9BACT|nr:sigma-70 family RNA polymerase sigma factor [Dyadobacter sediminis]TLU88977.1 sigma-70 family RNA polymerase sigma factor [Dyadobacter sediminis]GGC15864.1 hypothetical protein GCM10011325_48340 [Dyadobacter sediminis]